jgi:cystathionine beta-lyase
MISAELRTKMGVTEQMVRLSVGIESVHDLIEDLERALQVVAARVTVPVGSDS